MIPLPVFISKSTLSLWVSDPLTLLIKGSSPSLVIVYKPFLFSQFIITSKYQSGCGFLQLFVHLYIKIFFEIFLEIFFEISLPNHPVFNPLIISPLLRAVNSSYIQYPIYHLCHIHNRCNITATFELTSTTASRSTTLPEIWQLLWLLETHQRDLSDEPNLIKKKRRHRHFCLYSKLTRSPQHSNSTSLFSLHINKRKRSSTHQVPGEI